MKAVLNKKNILVSAIAILLIGTGVWATLAYLRDVPDELVNTFTVGNVTTEIDEKFEYDTGTTFTKEPIVVNTGENDCYVRARIVCSPDYVLEDSSKKALELSEFSNDWTEKEDGFYYYNKVLPAGAGEASKTDPIFKKVIVNDTSIDDFEVTVYQEAVQNILYAEDGTSTDVADVIWHWYDEGKIPETLKNE